MTKSESENPNPNPNPEPQTKSAEATPTAVEIDPTVKAEAVSAVLTKAAAPAISADVAFKRMMEKALPSIAAIIPKHLSPERLIKIALVSRQKLPQLRQCTPESFLLALIEAAEVGLEPNTPLQHAVLIPFNNKKTGKTEAQFMPMWRGLVCLARLDGGLKTARARIIYERDQYEIVEGVNRTIEHRPSLDEGDRGKIVLCYAIAEMQDGSVEWDYMTAAQIERIRLRSMAANSGPWVTDTEEMYKKTVLKRLMKQIPVGSKVAAALEKDDRGEGEGGDVVIDASILSDDVLTGAATLALPENGGQGKGQEVAQKIRQSRKPAQRQLD